MRANVTQLLKTSPRPRSRSSPCTGQRIFTHAASIRSPCHLNRKGDPLPSPPTDEDKEFISYWESLKTEDRKKTINTVQQQSEKAVRMFYLCRKVIADANIRISAQDIPRSSDFAARIPPQSAEDVPPPTQRGNGTRGSLFTTCPRKSGRPYHRACDNHRRLARRTKKLKQEPAKRLQEKITG